MTKYTRVFVYGTLLIGQPNHYLMTEAKNGEAKFIGSGLLKDKRPLVIGTPYNIPFLLDVPGKGENVKGEIFDIDDKMLAVLDELEGHPHFYEREILPFSFTNENVTADSVEGSTGGVWVYLLKKFNKKMLELPYYDHYDSTDASHSRPYKKSEDDLDDLSDLNDLIDKEVIKKRK